MGTFSILYNVVSFTELEVDTPVSLPHLLNVNEVPFVPRTIGLTAGGFTVTADDVNITVTRTADAAAEVDAYCEIPHTMDDVAPIPRTFTPPFIYGVGSGGGGSAFFAMALIANQESPVLLSGLNIDSISYDDTFLHINLVTPVPDVNKAVVSATLTSTGNAPNTISASMPTDTSIRVQILDVDGEPTFLGCNVLLALVP